MISFNKIISEEINRFVNEEFLIEKNKNHNSFYKRTNWQPTTSKESGNKPKGGTQTSDEAKDKAKKAADTRAQDKIKAYNTKYGHKEDKGSATDAEEFLKSDTINVSAVADKLVDMGVLNCKKGPSAQSYLRKMVNREAAPNGGNYGLHQNMVDAVEKVEDNIQ